MHLPIPTSPVGRSFAGIIDGISWALGKLLGRDRSATLLVSLIYARLLRLRAQFAALAARAEAGTLRAPRRHVAGRSTRTAAPRTPRPFPCGFGWLGNLAPEARCYGSQLGALVSHDPEVAALIVASPQAARILRSILWMTGHRSVPEVLRPAVARTPRVRVSRAVVRPAVPDRAPPVAWRHPYRPSAKWPKGCVTRPKRSRSKPRSTAGPVSKD